MATFNLPNSKPPSAVHLTDDLTEEQFLSFPAFKTWSNTLLHSLSLQSSPKHEFHKDPYHLHSITIQSVDWFGSGKKKRLGFVKMQTEVKNSSGDSIPEAVFCAEVL